MKTFSAEQITKKRWLSLILSMITTSVLIIMFVFSVLLGPVSEQRGWAIASILLAFTLMTWSAVPSRIIGGKIRDTWGDKKVIIIGILLYSLGCIACGYISQLVVFIIILGVIVSSGVNFAILGFAHNVGVLFPDKRGLAMGLYFGGVGLIQAFLIPVVSSLIEKFSPSIALLIMGLAGAAVLVICVPFTVFAPDDYMPEGMAENFDEAAMDMPEMKQVSWKKLLALPSIYFIILAIGLTDMNTEALMANASLIAQDITGKGAAFGALMASLFTITTGLGSIIIGAVSDKLGTFKGSFLIAIITGVIVVFSVIIGIPVVALVALIAVVGLSVGGFMTLLPVMVIESYGDKNYGVNYGIASLPFLITAYIGPQLTVAWPITNYFMMSGIMAIVGGVLFLLAGKSVKTFQAKE